MCLPFLCILMNVFLLFFFLAILWITLILSSFILSGLTAVINCYRWTILFFNLCFLLGVRHLSRVRHTDTSLLSTSLKAIPNNSRRRLKKTSSNLLLSSSLPLPLSRYRRLHFDEDGYDIPFDSSRITVNSADHSLERDRDRSGSFLSSPTCPSVGYPPMMSINEK